MDNSIFIFSGYKCASDTLMNTFHCKKSHSVFDESIIDDNIKVILLPFNNNIDKLCYSAYFQDIITPSYTYSPFHEENGFLSTETCENACGLCKCPFQEKRQEIIQNINVNKLLKHFLKVKNIMVNKDWVNTKLRNEIFKKILNINLNFDSDKIQTFSLNINNKIRKVIYFHISNINNNFDKLKYEVYGEDRPDVKVINKNVGKEKWYSEKYTEFLKKI
jgi:hypothetical protein